MSAPSPTKKARGAETPLEMQIQSMRAAGVAEIACTKVREAYAILEECGAAVDVDKNKIILMKPDLRTRYTFTVVGRKTKLSCMNGEGTFALPPEPHKKVVTATDTAYKLSIAALDNDANRLLSQDEPYSDPAIAREQQGQSLAEMHKLRRLTWAANTIAAIVYGGWDPKLPILALKDRADIAERLKLKPTSKNDIETFANIQNIPRDLVLPFLREFNSGRTLNLPFAMRTLTTREEFYAGYVLDANGECATENPPENLGYNGAGSTTFISAMQYAVSSVDEQGKYAQKPTVPDIAGKLPSQLHGTKDGTNKKITYVFNRPKIMRLYMGRMVPMWTEEESHRILTPKEDPLESKGKFVSKIVAMTFDVCINYILPRAVVNYALKSAVPLCDGTDMSAGGSMPTFMPKGALESFDKRDAALSKPDISAPCWWKCTKCAKANNIENFCGTCGSKRPASQWECIKCSSNNISDMNFCGNCGAAKPATEPSPAARELDANATALAKHMDEDTRYADDEAVAREMEQAQ